MAAPRPKKKVTAKGTLTERIGEARNRPYKGTKGGVPERTDRYGRGRLNTARTPDSIKMGQGSKGSVASKKTVPLGEKPKLLSGPKASVKPSIAGTLVRGAYRAVGGPAVMLVSMTVPAGEGSDRPSGPLFSPSKNRAAGKGNPKTVNPYRKSSGMGGGSKMADSTQSGGMRPKSNMTGNGRLRPEVKSEASDFKKKNFAANQKAGKDAAPAAQAPKAATPVIKKPAFKGNWTGAAPTEMQKRGGAKIKRPNLLSLFRKKMK